MRRASDNSVGGSRSSGVRDSSVRGQSQSSLKGLVYMLDPESGDHRGNYIGGIPDTAELISHIDRNRNGKQ